MFSPKWCHLFQFKYEGHTLMSHFLIESIEKLLKHPAMYGHLLRHSVPVWIATVICVCILVYVHGAVGLKLSVMGFTPSLFSRNSVHFHSVCFHFLVSPSVKCKKEKL